jgi:glycosyltransferase involved in cell wall biosynthesis
LGRHRARMATLTSPSVVSVLPGKVGGALNIVEGLYRRRRPDGLAYGVILTHNPLWTDARFEGRFHADYQATFEFKTPVENLYAVVRRLHAAIPVGEGVLVVNDLLELAMASAFDCGRAVVHVLHADTDYYYDLATRHEDVVDAFVVYGQTMERRLRERLPHRSNDIYFLPYGMPDPPRRRIPGPGKLRVLFAGRLEHCQKGVLDLPSIDRMLTERGVDVQWTIVGSGPDDETLRNAWTSSRASFLGVKTQEEVLEIASEHDVFVLPTRWEGVPVALLEAMSVGLVPVVSRVESGVVEILDDGITGFMPPVGDCAAFAEAIATLHANRHKLESMSAAATAYVQEHHDVRQRTDAYQALFAQYKRLKRPRTPKGALPYGSRLDSPWIPNTAVRAVRSVIRRAKGKPA